MLSAIFDSFNALGIDVDDQACQFKSDEQLPSWFETTELAASSFMAAGQAVAQLIGSKHTTPNVIVDKRLASLWFDKTLHPSGWQQAIEWDEIAGDYATRDGWIRLHTNAPHHKIAALNVLQCDPEREEVVNTVAGWDAFELQEAIVSAKGAAAQMLSMNQWQQHPQGKSVAQEPLVHLQKIPNGRSRNSKSPGIIDVVRPLAGIKVLDLTRVIAGPVCTRFLAAYGAEVLRIDPPYWDEPSIVPEMTLGKHCAQLDLKTAKGKAQLLSLVSEADVVVHGYRSDALDALGLGSDVLREHAPQIIDIALCAYGWSGPWAQRRGFDSLVQMSCGFAHHGMVQQAAEKPTPLPVQALDHATGYLMAAAAVHSLRAREREGQCWSARLSLASTAALLSQHRRSSPAKPFSARQSKDIDETIENTQWGEARRVRFPVSIGGCVAAWGKPAGDLKSAPAQWQNT